MVYVNKTRKQTRTRTKARSRKSSGGGLSHSRLELVPLKKGPVQFANNHGLPLTNTRVYEVNHNQQLKPTPQTIRRRGPATPPNPALSNYHQLVSHNYARLQEYVGNNGTYNTMMNVLKQTEMPSHLPSQLKKNIANKVYRNYYSVPRPGMPGAPAKRVNTYPPNALHNLLQSGSQPMNLNK
jgi:hypothetical protein